MGVFATIAYFVQAAQHPHGLGSIVRHLGGLGLFIFSIIDGSPIPTFGGLDIFTAILAERRREAWYYYTIIATAGAVIGAYITFVMARKAGLPYLTRKVGEGRASRLIGYFKQWETGALAVTTLVPLPFPTSTIFAMAGVTNYPLRTFLLVVLLCRGLRYGVIAVTASHYGRRVVLGLRNPQQHVGWVVGLSIAVATFTAAAIMVTNRLQSKGAVVKT